jgi:hypothetical protein
MPDNGKNKKNKKNDNDNRRSFDCVAHRLPFAQDDVRLEEIRVDEKTGARRTTK